MSVTRWPKIAVMRGADEGACRLDDAQMRRYHYPIALAIACGPAARPGIRGSGQAQAATGKGEDEGGGPPPCEVHDRRLSPIGRSAARPHVAVNGATLAVVWEDLHEDHPGIHF